MALYPPRGEETKALRLIQKICQRVEDLQGELEHVLFGLPEDGPLEDITWGITAEHALEGVRCNGREDTTTLADFAANAERFLSMADEVGKVAGRAQTALRDLVQVCRAFKLCPKCQGRKGEWTGQPRKHDSYWDDCSNCSGRGVLSIEKVQALKEYDT